MSLRIVNPLMVQSLEKARRNEVLRSALSIGAGIRQLSRLTGISLGGIQNRPHDLNLNYEKENSYISNADECLKSCFMRCHMQFKVKYVHCEQH